MVRQHLPQPHRKGAGTVSEPSATSLQPADFDFLFHLGERRVAGEDLQAGKADGQSPKAKVCQDGTVGDGQRLKAEGQCVPSWHTGVGEKNKSR